VSAKLAEIAGGLGNDIVVELEFDALHRSFVDRNVELDFREICQSLYLRSIERIRGLGAFLVGGEDSWGHLISSQPVENQRGRTLTAIQAT